MEYTIEEKPYDVVLERLARAAQIASRRSDAYAQRNQEYAKVYHEEITELCQAVMDAQRRA